VYAPPNGFTRGIVGVGAQSSPAFVDQLHHISGATLTGTMAAATELQSRGVAFGTDLNDMDWHAPPRFGMFAYYHADKIPEDPTRERDERQRFGRFGGIGPKVAYDSYTAATNPYAGTLPYCAPNSSCTSWTSTPRGDALHPLQVSSGGRVTRTFDINYDGLSHYGMLPDFMQELSIMGATAEEMGAMFRSAEGTIKMWEETCYLAYQMASPPRSLLRGCGPADLYR
jgi:hypothetical protein